MDTDYWFWYPILSLWICLILILKSLFGNWFVSFWICDGNSFFMCIIFKENLFFECFKTSSSRKTVLRTDHLRKLLWEQLFYEDCCGNSSFSNITMGEVSINHCYGNSSFRKIVLWNNLSGKAVLKWFLKRLLTVKRSLLFAACY